MDKLQPIDEEPVDFGSGLLLYPFENEKGEEFYF
jgi:hypothetical protein